MIRFTLTCDHNHSFESWFASNDACDKLMSAGLVSCTSCGSTAINKTLMAPALSKNSNIKANPSPLEKLRREVETNSEYVGGSFASQARDMHDGIIPEKAIYGEANIVQARRLIEDGIPVIPLPFIPSKKVN